MSNLERWSWPVIAIVGIDMVFLTGASNFLAAPQSRILNQVIVALVGLAFIVAAARGRIPVRSPLVLPGLAWIAAAAVSSALAVRPTISVEGLALLLLATPSYLLVRALLADERFRRRVDWLVIAAATVFVGAYLAQAFTQWISWWSVAGPSLPPLRPGDVGLTVGTVNAVALYLELLVPTAVVLSWVRWRRAPFSIGLASIAIVALIVTGSRGAWLGAVTGAAFGLLVTWAASGRPSIRRRITAAPRSLVALGAVIGVVLVVASPVLLTRVLAGDAGRYELWSAAWSLFQQAPIAGVGLGGWPDARALTPITESTLAVLTTSHNSVLQVLAETGLIGLLAGTWLLVVLARTGWRSIVDGPGDQRSIRIVAAASLTAAGVHSLFDTQFHLPAVVLLTFLLVGRLDPPGVRRSSPRTMRAAAGVAAVTVAVGAILLVPIDLAMVRGQLGKLALDRGDAAAAVTEYSAALELHDLPSYRLGDAIARARMGEAAAAESALRRLAELAPFTFADAQLAMTTSDPSVRASLLGTIEGAGAYDPAATVNAALLRYPTDRVRATDDLAAAMAAVPTLIYSDRPDPLFDEAVWSAARTKALQQITLLDPTLGAALATLAGEEATAAGAEAGVSDPADRAALAMLQAATTDGSFDLGAAKGLLRDHASSPSVQGVLWLLGFRATSQPLIDAVTAVSVPAFFGVPLAPMELVTDGRNDADYSVQLPRWPVAETSRQGPKRPYVPGFVTIEPVYRPKP